MSIKLFRFKGRRMKENGINKLIELLNESEDGFVSKFVSYDGINRVFRLDNGQSFHYTLILSKEYCFIKRLVENNKIDFNKINYPLRYNSYYPDRFGIVSTSVNDYEEYLRVAYNEYETLLMLLSISDNPIEFLISILK